MSRRRNRPDAGVAGPVGPGADAGPADDAGADVSPGTGAAASRNGRSPAGAGAGADTGPAAPAEEGAETAPAAVFSLGIERTESGEQRKARARERARRYREAQRAAKTPSEDAQTAAVLLTMLDGLVVSQLGVDCAMQEHERAMIEPPLTRMLARMTAEQRAAVQRYSDPVMMLWGLAVYGARVYRVVADRRSDDDAGGPPAPAPTPPPPAPARVNGSAAPDDIGAAAAPSRAILDSISSGGITL